MYKKILISIIAISLITGCGCNKKINTIENDTVEEIEDFELSDMEFIDNDNTIQLNIKNISEDLEYIDSVIVYLYDKDDELLEEVKIKIIETMGTNEEKVIQQEINVDKDKVASYTYELVR